MHVNLKNTFVGGMDSDSDAKAIAETDWKTSLNIRGGIAYAGKQFVVTNTRGNLEVPYTLPSGTNKCIGSYEDIQENTVIYFIWNSKQQHQILRYFPTDTAPYGTIELQIEYNFGWTADTLITGIQLINGRLLYWNDPIPKKVNIEKARYVLRGTLKEKCWKIWLPKTTSELSPSTVFTVRDENGNTIYTKTVDTSGEITATGLVANFVTIFPFDHIELVGIDASAATSITITGAGDPANNRTFTVRSASYTFFTNTTVFVVDQTVVPELALVNMSYTVSGDPRETIIKAIEIAFNTDANSPLEVEACACDLEICEKVGGTVFSITNDQPDKILIQALNWYGISPIDRFFDRIKWMPTYVPHVEYRKDTNYLPNYVKNKVFQFRLQYNYDDFEESALGIISQIPINNLGCDGTAGAEFNYINVNFDDLNLIDEVTLCIFRNVELLAREGNDGAWRSIIELTPCDFLDYEDGSLVARFDFYNDINSTAVSDDVVAKQYDDVPLEAVGGIVVKNRGILANVLKGYDAPDCIDAKYQIDFVEEANPPLRKVSGKIRVLTWNLEHEVNDPNNGGGANKQLTFYNLYPLYRKYPFWESSDSNTNRLLRRGGIFHDISRTENDFAFYGGGGYGQNGDFGIRAGMEDVFDQRIPEGGFPVYAANTQYLTISRQKSVGLPVDTNGALDTSTPDKRSQIGDYYVGEGDLYSEFELMLPDGVYVIRLASHLCSFDDGSGDKLGKGFPYNLSNGTNYQQTSTNVWCVLDTDGNLVKSKEITITVSGSDIYIGEFVVADLAPPHDVSRDRGGVGWMTAAYWTPIGAYLVASSDTASTDINSVDFNGVTIEKTLVSYGESGTAVVFQAEAGSITGSITIDTGWQESCFTDHNGFWFGIVGANFTEIPSVAGTPFYDIPIKVFQVELGAVNDVREIRSSDFTFFEGSLTEYFGKTLIQRTYGAGSLGNDSPLLSGVISTNLPNGRETSSTFIDGTVIDQNTNGVSGISIVYENGLYENTQTDGSFSLLAWGDMITENLGNVISQTNIFIPESNANRIVDRIIIGANIFCLITFPSGQFVVIEIDPFSTAATGYNPTVHYDIGEVEVNEGNMPSEKARKRGGTYLDAIRLSDDAGRFTTVVKAFELYMPFITEDIGVYNIEDFSGNVYPTGTFRYGKPSIKWVLSPDTTFPAWAKSFQWLRLKNATYGRYLQWVANEVVYISSLDTDTTPEIRTSFQNRNATAIKISIKNILDYQAQRNNSQVSYAYEIGDRIRLIADRGVSYINGLVDFEVTGYDATTQEIIIDPQGYSEEIQSGSLFEVYNSQTLNTNDGQIYYEVGERINILGGFPESYSGIFSNGDTYWRGRTILVNDDSTNFSSTYPLLIEDAAVSDFYPSTAQDIGRAGLIDEAFKQIHYPTMLQNSGIYIEGTAVNGLSSFASTDNKQLSRSFGAIKSLNYVGNTLLSIHENKVVANYIELRSLSDSNETDGLLAISDAYFGNDRPMLSEYGSQHTESIIQYNGLVYAIDAAKGVIWRYDNNGLDVLSDKKMRSYVKDLCAKGVTFAPAVFDNYYREYIVSVYTSDQNVTLAWNEEKNRWTTFYSHLPELYASVLRSIVSFKNGELWIHDRNPIHNNFYGTQYRTELTFVPHTDTQKSTFHTILIQGVQNDPLTNNWFAEEVSNDFGQLSRIKQPHFRLKENFWAASFLRDTTDTTVVNPIINGRNLRGQELTIKLVNDSTESAYIQQIVTSVVASERTPK